MQKNLSRFMRKTLMPDERVIREGHFSWFYTFSALFYASIFTGLGGLLYWKSRPYIALPQPYPIYAGIFLGGWIVFSMMLKKWTTEIVLTDQRIIYKRGFFMIKADEVDIEQLASDNVEQTLIGRMFDYGVVHIRCIEASDIWLPPLSQPYEFRNAVEHQKHLYREEYMKVQRLRQHGDHH